MRDDYDWTALEDACLDTLKAFAGVAAIILVITLVAVTFA